MRDIRTVGVVAKPGIESAGAIVPGLIEWLRGHDLDVRYDYQVAAYLGENDGMEREVVPDGCQLVIVLGGDGTLLSAARAVGAREIPLFAVNLGGLGFLTAISREEIYPELERALRGEHRIAQRRMLHCELVRDGNRVGEYTALNDVVLTKASLARMIEVEIRVSRHFVAKYRADGLIVCTPTGSTAYSLSAGGPIVFPAVPALCITPICPHMLTYRPVLLPDDMEIHITCRAERESAYLTIDGQVGEAIQQDDVISCRRSDACVHLIRPPRMMFFDVLREKLSWGER